MKASLALGALLAFAGFTVAVADSSGSTKFVIRTIHVNPSNAGSSGGNSYGQPAPPSYGAPPSPPPSSTYGAPPPPQAYEQSSSGSGSGYGSSGSSYADPTACSNDAECAAVDPNAECRYAKCQCKAPYVAENVGLSPITTMSMRSAVLDNRDATTVYLPPPMVNITCVLPFALLGQTCLIQTSCCLTADEQARLTAQSSCVVAPDPATLAAFNAPLPTVTYATVGAPAGVLIDAATGSITTNASFVGPVATVTVQAMLSSNPAQVATTTVTLVVVAAYEGTPVSDLILIDFSGNTVPTFGASLSDLFDRPCNKQVNLVSAVLAPTSDATSFCPYLMFNSNNQLVFQTSTAGSFPDALINALNDGTLLGVTAECAINVTVAACNGNELATTVTAAFSIPPGSGDLLTLIKEKAPHLAGKVSQIRKDKKKKLKMKA